MKRALYLLVTFVAAAFISNWMVKNDALHGDTFRDAIAFTFMLICITGIGIAAWTKAEEIERKRSKKRNNEIIYLDAEAQKEIEKKETA